MLTDSYINNLTGGSDAATTKTPSEEGVWVSQWETIHAGALLMAGSAITEKSWAHLRQAEDVMSTAKAGFDPLVVAIMGVRAPDLSNRLLAALHTAGQHATADQINAAQALIKQNAEQMDARRQAARAEQRPARPQSPKVDLGLPPIGTQLTLCALPYRVLKNINLADRPKFGYVSHDGKEFRVISDQPMTAGQTVRVTAHDVLKHYGVQFHLRVEMV